MSWTVIKHLGEGGFGSVSLATWSPSPDDDIGNALNLPPLFAVKSAPHSNSDSLEYERELLHELRDCPSIIRCYGADACLDVDGDIVYNIFLQYAAGGSLADRIYSGEPLGEEEIKDYTRSILRGLKHMHGMGMVHCDIKPDNVLLVVDECTGGYLAKIGDLGLAIQEEFTDGSVKCRGTLPYLAPESVLFGQYWSGIDIWAVGCTVAEMFVRKQLREVKPGVTWEMVKQMAKQGVRIPHGISEDARDFLTKCLSSDPALRWSADRLLKDHPFVRPPDYIDLGCTNELSDLSYECSVSSDVDEDDETLMPMKLLKRYREDIDDDETLMPMKLLKRYREDISDDDVNPGLCKKPKLVPKSAVPLFLRGL